MSTRRVLFIRHAEAMDRAEAGKRGISDADRALTLKGMREMKELAKGIARLCPEVSRIRSSPLIRAKQTADILNSVYRKKKIVIDPLLCPEVRPSIFWKALRSHLDGSSESKKSKKLEPLVGHEPALSQCLAWALGGNAESFLLKKGGACLIEFRGKFKRGAATLVCFIQPSRLKKLIAVQN